jgi:hypothetical protein
MGSTMRGCCATRSPGRGRRGRRRRRGSRPGGRRGRRPHRPRHRGRARPRGRPRGRRRARRIRPATPTTPTCARASPRGGPCCAEKPLAATADAARRVVDAEAAGGRRLVQVGFMRRFDPGYVALRDTLDAGRVGAPVVVHSIHRNRSVPPGFGTELILKDTLVHDVDVVRYLLGRGGRRGRPSTPGGRARSPPTACRTRSSSCSPRTRASSRPSRRSSTPGTRTTIRCEVVGETGTVELPAPPEPATGFEDRFAAAYTAELRAWVAAVGSGVPAGASAWDGYGGRGRVRGGLRVAALRRAGRRRPRAAAGPVPGTCSAGAMSSGAARSLKGRSPQPQEPL